MMCCRNSASISSGVPVSVSGMMWFAASSFSPLAFGSVDKAAANSKAAKDAKAKETKEEKEKREKYEKHMKKAEELITAKNHKDAITALQQARMYATADKQKEVDEKIAEQKKTMNQGSLFDMMEETPAPAPQVVQPQNVVPQPAQQTIQPQAAPRQMPPQPQHTIMRPVQQPMQRPVLHFEVDNRLVVW